MNSKNSNPPVNKREKKLLKRHASPAAKRDLGPPWRVILNVLLIFVLSQAIALFLVEFVAVMFHAQPDNLDSSNIEQFFYVLIAEGLAAYSVVYIVRRRKLSFSSVGLGRKPIWRDLFKAGLGFLAYYLLLTVVSIIVVQIFPNYDKGSQDVGFNTLNTLLDSILAFCALVVFPPIGEEILVRGYLYGGLRQKLKFVPAMLITSLLFGAAHLFTGDSGLLWGAALNTFVLSIVLVYLRENTGALYAGMLVHGLNNAIAFGFHFHALMF